MRRETLWIAALLSTNIRETSADGCCFWPQSDDRCDVGCESIAESSNYCAGGVDECNVDCGAVWCYDGPQPSREPTRSRAPTPEGGAWHEGTYTTGYWDCCKPSCSWSGKGDVDAPVRSCEAETGDVLSSPDVTVTSQADKVTQLAKLKLLRAFRGDVRACSRAFRGRGPCFS